MPRLAGLAVLALFALAACAPVGTRELHEVYLYGMEDARLSYAYGSARTLPLPEGEVSLGPTVESDAEDAPPYAATGARRVDDEPYLREPLEPLGEAPLSVARVPLTTDLRLRTAAPVELALYFDGRQWFTLASDLPAGRDVDVTPRQRLRRLRGVGQLAPNEADALADAVEARGEAAALAVLAEDGFPERSIDGLDAYRRTGVYVQSRVERDPSAYRSPPEERIWEVIASGDQAGPVQRDRYLLIDDRSDLVGVWNRVHAGALEVPPLPDVNFERETVLAVLLSERPTGGYAVEPASVVEQEGELFVDVRLQEPGEDAFVTQAVTRPWLLLRVLRSGIDVAWFRTPGDGSLIGVARPGDTLD